MLGWSLLPPEKRLLRMKEGLVEVLRLNPQKRHELKRAISENHWNIRIESTGNVISEAVSLMGDGHPASKVAKRALCNLIEAAIEEAEKKED